MDSYSATPLKDRILDTQPTTVLLYPDSRQLTRFRHAEQLISLINKSYYEKGKAFFYEVERTPDIESSIQELGEGTFTLILCSSPAEASAAPTIYAAGSARPYKGDRPDSAQSIWTYRTPPEEDLTGVDRWELKLMAVRVDLQGQGIGDYMLGLLNMEILRRFRAGQMAGSGMRRCQTVLVTMQEVNGLWYEKRGYVLRSEIQVGKGQYTTPKNGAMNHEGFHTICMSKFIA